MGTRGLYGFCKNEEFKLAYNHYDSYPSWLGEEVLSYARAKSVKELNKIFDSIKMINVDNEPTFSDIEKWQQYTDLSVGSGSTTDWYCLMRKAQGDLEAFETTGQMPDDKEFFNDGLFCEWCYIINLDSNNLEIYRNGKNIIKAYSLKDLPEHLDEDYLYDLEY